MITLGLTLYTFFHICMCVLLYFTNTPESTEDWIRIILWPIDATLTLIYVLFILLLLFFKKGLYNFFKALWNLIKDIPKSFKTIWDEIINE